MTKYNLETCETAALINIERVLFDTKFRNTKAYLPQAASIVDFWLIGTQEDSMTLDLFSL